MKKVLSILSTFILTSSATLVLTGTVDTHNQTKNENKTGIDWRYIKNNNSNYFNNFKNNQRTLSEFSVTKSDEIASYAERKANDYIEMFQNKDFNLNQVIQYLSTENSQFKDNYNKILQEQNNFISQQLNQVNTINILDVKVLDAQQEFATLDAHVKKLRIESTIFTTLSVAAAVAAAGFWAAAWFFGISIPWALAATAVSIATGILLAGINISLVKYDKELNGINKASLTFGVTYKLGNIIYEILKPILITVEGTLTATTWAVPAVTAAIGVIATISSWIRLYE